MAGIGNSVLFRGGQPRGVTRGGYLTVIGSNVVPGIVMEFTGANPISGNRGWRPYQPGTSGQRRMIAVLLDDSIQGTLPTAATPYVLNQNILLYFPLMGEKMYMPLDPSEGGSGYGSGFGPNLTVPTDLMVKSGTGLLVPAPTGVNACESIPFRLEEEVDYKSAADEIIVWAVCTTTGY